MKLKIGLMKGGVCVHVCVQNNYAGVGLASGSVCDSAFEHILGFEPEAFQCLHCYVPRREGEFGSCSCRPSSSPRAPGVADRSPGARCSE